MKFAYNQLTSTEVSLLLRKLLSFVRNYMYELHNYYKIASNFIPEVTFYSFFSPEFPQKAPFSSLPLLCTPNGCECLSKFLLNAYYILTIK